MNAAHALEGQNKKGGKMNINQERKQKSAIYPTVAQIVLVTMVGGLLLSACGAKQDHLLTIGVIIDLSIHAASFEGLKAGMADLGYVEEEDVTYIYSGDTYPDAAANEIENMMAQDVDLLFTAGNACTTAAQEAVEGTDVPVVFCAVAGPVEEGYVESIRHPGGNLTGVQVGGEIPKALEWLVTITPEADKVYVPYNPDEGSSTMFLAVLEEVTPQLGIELVPGEVRSVEESVAAIENLPEDVDAIFRVPSATLDSQNSELSQAAIRRGLPMGAGLPLDEAVLLTLASDLFEAGKQAARLAHQIAQGVKPADLPVETAEFSMTINLKTAEAIGLDIPDMVLQQADTIIR
jgi:putative ABC transport system substrate-binding protein